MSPHENSNPSRQNRQPWSLDEFLSICLFATATLFAAFAIVCRWFVPLEGQILQLWLIAGGLTAALMIVRRIRCARLTEIITMGVFGVTALTTLCLWSPNMAFAVMVCLPLALAAGLPWCLYGLGYELQRVGATPPAAPGREVPDRLRDPIPSPIPEPTGSLETTIADAALQAGAAVTEQQPAISEESDSQEEREADDPWLTVQGQFASDASLEQNVTQWQQPDGSRSFVANVRCRFQSPLETVVVHLPFWPLWNSEPEVFCRVASGPDAVVKVTQQFPHGLRLEVRLSDRTCPTPLPDVIVEVIAAASHDRAENAA